MSVVAKIDSPERDRGDKRLFDAVGAFLFQHRLEPSPANYLLAYLLVTKSHAAAVAAIEEATGDGLRLNQRDADRIIADTGLLSGAPASSVEAMRQVRNQLDMLEAIVGSTQAHAERYGRDLQNSAEQLNTGAASVSDLLRLTAEMIGRTKEAEQQLHSTNEEVRLLRRELANASEEARTDPLTGLPNRRALEDRFKLLQGTGTPFCAAVCDIDSFKTINDKHGHSVGDRVLKAVARVLEGACPGQMVSRYGGEEFVVLLANTRVSAASALIDSARVELAARRFKVRETDHPIGSVTVSAGIAEIRPGETWSELLMRADELLYRAKGAGRNRVEVDQADVAASGAA